MPFWIDFAIISNVQLFFAQLGLIINVVFVVLKIKLEKGQTVAINFGYQAAHYFGHEEFVAEETV